MKPLMPRKHFIGDALENISNQWLWMVKHFWMSFSLKYQGSANIFRGMNHKSELYPYYKTVMRISAHNIYRSHLCYDPVCMHCRPMLSGVTYLFTVHVLANAYVQSFVSGMQTAVYVVDLQRKIIQKVNRYLLPDNF